MDKKLAHIIHQLKGKSYPESIHKEFYRYGKEAYNSLEEGISNGSFTSNQVSNALLVMRDLTRQACQDKRRNLFSLALKYLTHGELVVRTSAISIIIGLVRLQEQHPQSELYQLGISNREEIFPEIKLSMDLGVDENIESYVQKFLKEK